MPKTNTDVKTNAVRLLDQAGVAYELREYDVDESDLSAESVAGKIGLPPEQVFKTLITQAQGADYLFALLPAYTELDLRLLAGAAGRKRVEVVPLRDVQAVTGYVRGGVSPLGGRKPYPVFLDETVQLWDVVSISAGRRGLQMLLAPADLIRVTHATLADLVRAAASE